MKIEIDTTTEFPAFSLSGGTKAQRRQYCAEFARIWLSIDKSKTGAIMLDIDDTLLNEYEKVTDGFEYMKQIYEYFWLDYIIHIVTARPDNDKPRVMALLQKLGMSIPVDRLHLLPAAQYESDDHVEYTEKFKWNCYKNIKDMYGKVVLRMGDKMWDVAHFDSLHMGKQKDDGYLSHVDHRATYIFKDPRLHGCLSCKLPG